MHLFIDTNIYLTFYHYSNDDLEELRKLLIAIKSKQIKLLLPTQAIDELNRNREAKIADALKLFNEQKLPGQFPQIFKGYNQYKRLIDLGRDYQKIKMELTEELMIDICNKNLGADKIIKSLFNEAMIIDIDSEILSQAKSRFDRGNPPGKTGSYGDAINWESLLKFDNNSEDLCFIARDKDYLSLIDNNKFSEFLTDEWTKKKSSQILYYPTLSNFFVAYFPEIKKARDMERKIAIRELVNSNNFSTTHMAIAKLTTYSDYTEKEISEITDAFLSNSQIIWIHEDDDVFTFITWILGTYSEIIPDEKLDQINKIYISQAEWLTAPF